MSNAFMTIEDQLLVTATGGAGRPVSFIEPSIRQAFGDEAEQILKLPFGEQARLLNARLRCNAGK
jgi:hypothetical protein